MSGEGAQLPCALVVGAVTLCSWALSSSYRAQLPTDLFYFLVLRFIGINVYDLFAVYCFLLLGCERSSTHFFSGLGVDLF